MPLTAMVREIDVQWEYNPEELLFVLDESTAQVKIDFSHNVEPTESVMTMDEVRDMLDRELGPNESLSRLIEEDRYGEDE